MSLLEPVSFSILFMLGGLWSLFLAISHQLKDKLPPTLAGLPKRNPGIYAFSGIFFILAALFLMSERPEEKSLLEHPDHLLRISLVAVSIASALLFVAVPIFSFLVAKLSCSTVQLKPLPPGKGHFVQGNIFAAMCSWSPWQRRIFWWSEFISQIAVFLGLTAVLIAGFELLPSGFSCFFFVAALFTTIVAFLYENLLFRLYLQWKQGQSVN